MGPRRQQNASAAAAAAGVAGGSGGSGAAAAAAAAVADPDQGQAAAAAAPRTTNRIVQRLYQQPFSLKGKSKLHILTVHSVPPPFPYTSLSLPQPTVSHTLPPPSRTNPPPPSYVCSADASHYLAADVEGLSLTRLSDPLSVFQSHIPMWCGCGL